MTGRTINIYLPDGNPKGIRVCDFHDSIVKAIAIPRNKLDDVSSIKDLNEPGIYFLIGDKDELGRYSVYIGEADGLLKRIKQHNTSKDFWQLSICFVSEKKNLNKAHIKYLENYCCEEAKIANKCSLENSNSPTKPSLNDSNIDFAMKFYEDLKILISTLGYPIFDITQNKKQNIYFCKGKDASAKGEYVEDGLLVHKGSKANIEEAPSIANNWKTFRQNLITKSILKKEGNTYVFQEDFLFSSPSAAAIEVTKSSINGWIFWECKLPGKQNWQSINSLRERSMSRPLTAEELAEFD